MLAQSQELLAWSQGKEHLAPAQSYFVSALVDIFMGHERSARPFVEISRQIKRGSTRTPRCRDRF